MGGRLYHYVESEDDMESDDDMEADYSDIMDEEERAQQIADQEDEDERLRQKDEQKRRKHRKLIQEGKNVLLDDVSSDEFSDD